MNKICIGFVLLIVTSLQLTLKAQDQIKFSEIVEVAGVSKDVLYSNGLIWFAETFKDSRSVIEAKDREAGMIIGNGIINYTAPGGMKYKDVHGYVEFSVKAMFKEGRTKIELTSFMHKPHYKTYSLGIITESENYPYQKVNNFLSQKWHEVLWDDLRNVVMLKANNIVENYKKFMVDNSANKDDW